MVAVLAVCMILITMIVAFLAFRFGAQQALRKDIRAMIRKSGITVRDVQLYREAARILNRLINVTDLDGDLAADVVSPATRQKIEAWMIDYRKELDQK